MFAPGAAVQPRGSEPDGISCAPNRFAGLVGGRAGAMNSAPLPWSFSGWGDETLVGPARDVAADVDGSLALARTHDDVARSMGHDTWRLFSALATLGSVDLTSARAVEPHWDAVAILDQAGARHPEAQPGASTRPHPRAPASRQHTGPTAAGSSPARSRGARSPTGSRTHWSRPPSRAHPPGCSPWPWADPGWPSTRARGCHEGYVTSRRAR